MVWIVSAFVLILTIGIYFNQSSVAGGVEHGRLAVCPNRPNCVCSQEEDAEHGIDPLDVKDVENPMDQLTEVINSFPRVKVISQEPRYLHVVFRSKVFHFADDVEFYLVPQKEVIHVRSASRLGYRDFGVNRARVEDIRKKMM